tara:strand:- start:266 stop:508 length:243 start_codon:yes stop_codon:yes gene_type:complete
MKVGQIVTVNKSGLARFAPGIRRRLMGEIGLVVQENYDLAYRVIDGVKVQPAVARFESLHGLSIYEDGVMLYPDQVEVLS